jgi:hypothetical protein
MDKETANYIIQYFSQLLTQEERLAIKHTMSLEKLSNSTNSNLDKIFKQAGWITENQTAIDLLKDGYDAFEIKVAKRICNNHQQEVFLNNCEKCGKLARTPYAKQCRHCGHNWHS